MAFLMFLGGLPKDFGWFSKDLEGFFFLCGFQVTRLNQTSRTCNAKLSLTPNDTFRLYFMLFRKS